MKWLLFLLAGMHNNEDPRQVLIFYQPSSEKVYYMQMNEFNNYKPGFKERDIEIKKFRVDTLKKNFMDQYEIDPGQSYTLIIVGRDGGEKFRSNSFVKAAEVFAIIDAMPMRRLEMKKGKSVGN